MLSTKEELYLYLEKISRGYALKDLKYFTANHISESLNISRNLASQYLNELVKEGVNCIELCGGFGSAGAKAIIEATGNEIPIGYITHLPEQDELYAQVFSKK